MLLFNNSLKSSNTKQKMAQKFIGKIRVFRKRMGEILKASFHTFSNFL